MNDSLIQRWDFCYRVHTFDPLERVDRDENLTHIGVDEVLTESNLEFIQQGLLVEVLELSCQLFGMRESCEGTKSRQNENRSVQALRMVKLINIKVGVFFH